MTAHAPSPAPLMGPASPDAARPLPRLPRAAGAALVLTSALAIAAAFVVLVNALAMQPGSAMGDDIVLVTVVGAIVLIPVMGLLALIATSIAGLVISAVDRRYDDRRLLLITLVCMSTGALVSALATGALLSGDGSDRAPLLLGAVAHLGIIAVFAITAVRLAGVRARAAVIVAAVPAAYTVVSALLAAAHA
ncbi:hypothetical protein [Clavibacter michiganensis]|uniref:hypothetical protein n=1 Tax=Clavibacter michiganensis TaxID=28447 RepID=UPI003EB797BD